MVDNARAVLNSDIGPRVLIEGFSAAGMFANRFAVLHPDRVLAAAIGSPGGWPIAPMASAADLKYPVGVSDIRDLIGAKIDEAALRRVKFFFFLGAEDRNDSVPFRDSFSAEDEAVIDRRSGATPVARWAKAAELYRRAGLDATFELYPTVGHTVTPKMQAEVEAMFRSALSSEQRP